MTASSDRGPQAVEFAVPLVCPVCHEHPLERRGDRIVCPDRTSDDCPHQFAISNGFPDLIVGGRFDDPTDDECMAYEEGSNLYTAEKYWVPLFRRLHPRHEKRRPRILAVGCGTGVEVDVLNRADSALLHRHLPWFARLIRWPARGRLSMSMVHRFRDDVRSE